MRERASDLEIEKKYLIAFSVPMLLRSFEKSLARNDTRTLIINSEKYGSWMRYFDRNERDLGVLEDVSHLRSNTFIRLKFDGKIDSRLHEVLRIFERRFDAVSILDLDQVYRAGCGSPAQSLRQRTTKRVVSLGRIPYTEALAAQNANIGPVLSMVVTAKQSLLLQCSKQPETNRSLQLSALDDFGKGQRLSVIFKDAQNLACARNTFERVRWSG